MLNPFENANWIAPTEVSASPIIKREFSIEQIGCAKLNITGLGYFEARLNGVKLGDEYFQPVVSDYEPRSLQKITYPCHDTFTHRIYYRTFDVSPYIQPGMNTLEIQLGNGWYIQNERICEGEMSFGELLKCIYTLELGAEVLTSDGSETWCDSEIVYSNLFIGERHDPTAARKHGSVQIVAAPESELCEQIGAPDRCVRKIRPALIAEKDGRSVYDVGENISGIVRVKSRESYLGEIVLRFAEDCNEDGTLDFESAGSWCECGSGVPQIMTDVFVCDGKERSFEPKFVWHAFRYFDVQGDIASAEVLVIHADVRVTSEFDSDSEGLNFLYDAYLRTQLNNMHGSIPSDCPHRERLGYTGDGQIAAPAAMLMMDSQAFYRKWIRDILDCQDTQTGHVQHTAPFQGGGGGPGGWGCAIIIVPYWYWRQWDDLQMIEECWKPMQRWIGFLIDHSTDGLVTSEIDGGWCLGDWCTLEPCRLPEPYVNTYYLIQSLRMVCEMAAAIGKESEIPALRKLEEASLAAIKKHYFNQERGVYIDGTQSADAYAAALGIQDAKVCAMYYKELGHFDTGFLGTDVLCEVMFQNRFADIAYQLLTNEELGSFLYMKRNGATTLWESWTGKWLDWDGRVSKNHPMFGAVSRQLFQGILGIHQSEDSCGWKRVEINPQLPVGMNRASGSILTPRGRIHVALERKEDGVLALVQIPGEIDARLDGEVLPAGVSSRYVL